MRRRKRQESTAGRVRSGATRRLSVEPLEGRDLLAVSVVSTAETENTSSADDAAIWIHPTDPAQSTIIGAIKSSSSALRVYDLSGNELGRVSSGNVNNVDLRYNFPLSGQPTTLVVGSNRSNDSISIYRVNPQTRLLENVAARTISTGMDIYGAAMYVSPVTGKYYAFVTSESGQVQQWELFDDGSDEVDATQVRNFFVGSISEGVVADDVLGWLYVGEENDGIWKYSAEPDGGTARTLVDSTGGSGHLEDDVEGLTIYYASDGTGYLLASSQGADEFVVYEREGNNSHIGEFELIAGGGIDAVSNTDGIDVTNVSLGGQFPQGMFVAQDNDVNFKLARWDSISSAFGGQLTIDTSWDPRQIGAAPTSVVDRRLFYNNSAFDNVTNDDAIAPDKSAYSAGDGTAGAGHVSSYARGINGLIVDVANPKGTLTAADFTFKVGANNSPGTWSAAPVPTTFSVRPDVGTDGADRVEIIWDDGEITNTWLQVTVNGNDTSGGFNTNTGLAASDIFYFGNRIGDTLLGTPAQTLVTSAADEIGARTNAGANATLLNVYDFDRNGVVTAADQIVVRSNAGFMNRINIPSPPSAVELAYFVDASAIASALAATPPGFTLPSPELTQLVHTTSGEAASSTANVPSTSSGTAQFDGQETSAKPARADFPLDDDYLDALMDELESSWRSI